MKLNKLFFLLSVICFAASVQAQKDYDKPADKLSKDEALKIVSESPWAKTYQAPLGSAISDSRSVAREQSQSVYGGGSNPRSVARSFGPPPVVMRLHSSDIVRKATVRLQQVEAGYDKMSDADKAKFNDGRKNFMACNICKDYYVVSLTKFREVNATTVEEGIFQGMTLDQLKGNIALVNDKGERRELVQFNPPSGPADSTIFYFKRNDAAGNPLITPETKELSFVFTNTFLDSKNRFAYLLPRSFDFRVSKMMVGDKVAF